MYKAVTERKLIADDYFTAQLKVRHILEAVIRRNLGKYLQHVYRMVSYNNDDPEASKIRVIVQHKYWPYGGFRLFLVLFADSN